ncbi:MAG: hypothetical protein ACTSU5_16350 [Promethearchaeota archaeon]
MVTMVTCPHGLPLENCPHCNPLANVKPTTRLGVTEPRKLPDLLDPSLTESIGPRTQTPAVHPQIPALRHAPARLSPSSLGVIGARQPTLFSDRLSRIVHERPGQKELDELVKLKELRDQLE